MLKQLRLVAIVFALACSISVSVQPALAASIGHAGSNGKIQPATSDPNDPIQSGCYTTAYTVTHPAPGSFTYNGHTFQVQIRVSTGCHKDWARLWETNGSGDCIYGTSSGNPILAIQNDSTGDKQIVTGSYLCHDAWTDMVSDFPGFMLATMSNGAKVLTQSGA